MKGGPADIISSHFEFEINKCVNETYPDVICKTPGQIDEYIKDIEINIWKFERNIDFYSYSLPPTFLI
jgi:hypothetical protein